MPTLKSTLLLSSNADYPLINASENNIDGQFTIFFSLGADPTLTQEDSADDFSFDLEVVSAGGTATLGKDYSLVIQEGNLEKSLTSLGSSISLNDISLSPTSSIANVGITAYMGLITLLVRPIDDSIIEIDPETIDLELKITAKNSNNQEDSIIFSGSDIVNIEDYEFTPSISNYTPVIYETALEFGDAVSFDGVNDYVELTDGSVAGAFDGGSTAFTITGWIKPNSLSSKTTNHQIENVFLARATSGSNDNFELGITTDGKLNLYLDTDGGDTTIELGNGELTTGEWHSFALVFDSGSVTAYIDGIKYTGSVSGTQLDSAVGTPFTLGASINVDTFYDGEIDELGIWNAALTEDEIIDIRYNTLSGDEDNLVAYYNFDEDSVDGNTINDLTSNGNNGTFTNGNGDNFDSSLSFKGHVDIELANKVNKQPGVILSYQIDSDSTATQDEDFYNSQTDISTTDGEPQTDSIFIAEGEDSARIYLTALPDAVVEGDENIKLTLLPDFNKALDLDGSGDYVNLNNSVVGLAKNDFTLEAWIKTTGTGEAIISKNDGDTNWERGEKAFYINNSGQVDFVGWGNNYIRGTTAVNDGQWHHVAVVWDYSSGTVGTGKIYVDGVDDTSSSGYRANNGYKIGDTLKIGRPNYGEAPNNFSGEIDEVRIWNKARTQAEIQDTIYVTLKVNESNLVAYYNFNDDSVEGNVISDVSANKSLSFDGSNDYVSVSLNEPETEITHEFWFKTTKDNVGMFSISNDSGVGGHDRHIYLKNGNIYTRVWNNEVISTTGLNLADGEWHHVAHVIGNSVGGQRIYIDGKLEATGTKAASNFDWNDTVRIGFSKDATFDYFDGEIDEVRIWNKARTQAEIQSTRNSSLNGNESNLLAYYTFDDGSATDLTSNNNNGTINGATSVNLDGQLISSNKVLSLDGNGDYVDIPNESNFDMTTNRITVEAWIKVDNFDTRWQAIVTKGDNSWRLHRFNQTNQINFAINGLGSISSNTEVNDGQWHHIAGVYNGTKLQIYIDGTLENEINASGSIPNSTYKVNIGENAQRLGRHFHGQIDEVRIWNTARSANEIQNYRNQKLDGTENGLVAYYSFDDGTANDNSSNGNNGSFIGNATTTNNNNNLSIGVPASVADNSFTDSLAFDPFATNGATYSIEATQSAEITIKDTDAYTTGVLIVDEYGDEISNTNSAVVDENGEAKFKIKLSSQPTANVTINLNTNQGSLDISSFTFNDSNWDTYQEITVSGLASSFNDFNITATFSSTDTDYNNGSKNVKISDSSNNVKVKVTEGGPELELTPTVSITATSDATEGNESESGVFTVSLDTPAPEGGLVVPVSVSSTATEGTDYNLYADSVTYSKEKALSFDGVDDYVQLTDGGVSGAFDGGSTAFTITGWIKPNSLSSKSTNHAIENVFLARASDSSNDNFELGITTNGKLNLYLDTNGGDTTIELGNGELTTGEWHSFALVFNSGSVTAYIDGTEYTGSVKGTQLDQAVGSPFTLGASIHIDTFYDGEIDEVSIWKKVLTQSEIQENLYTKLEGTEDSLVAYYNFDDLTTSDVTENGNDGTFNNAGQSLSLDGVDDYVKVPNSDEFELTDGTIEFWVKPDWAANSKNFNPAVLANRDTSGTRYSIHIRRNLNGVDLWNGSQVGTVSYNFEQGNWYHVALVETGTSTEVFINGEFQGSMSRGFSQATGKDFHIGSSDGTREFFEGEIDEVRIWNKTRTQEEIQENLHTKLTGTEDGLVAYYNFDNDSGTTITDGTGSNNGTLNNGDGNNLVGSSIGYTSDWEVTQTPVVKIAEGETEATISVSKIDNQIAESTAETVTVTLKDSVDYDLDISNQTATVNLNDDDEAGIEFAKLTTSNGITVPTSLEYYNNTLVTSEVATIELEVTSDYADGNVGLKIVSGNDSYTLTAGTQLSFSDGSLVTVDTDTTISTDDAVILVPVTFINAIATQETISFTDEQSGTAIEVGVSTGYNATTGEVGLQISSGVDALTFSNGTQLTFSNGAVVTLTQDTNISSSTETLVPVSFANQILTNETSEIELPGEDNTTFGVRLSSQPTDDVTLTLTIGDSTEGQFANSTSTQTLNFTTENWDSYQEVTLYGVDDDIDDDSAEDEDSNTLYDYSIDVTTTSQNDSNYNLQISDAVFVNNQDNESTEDSNNNVNTNNSATNIASINVINSELREDGTTTAQFEINLSEAAPEGGTYVKYEIGDGTGTIREDVFAYTLIGDDNPLKSYLTIPLSDLGIGGSSPIFVDIDGDEDLDVFIGRSGGLFAGGGIDYYENTGDKSNPIFTERTGSDNPLNQVSANSNVPSFVDIDNDGDLDAFVGFEKLPTLSFTPIGGEPEQIFPPTIFYYENTGNSTNPVFERRTGTNNPLEELITDNIINQSVATFGDMDNDGDFDIFVGGKNGKISYFENIGSADSPIFQRLGGSNNPFNGIDFGDNSAPTLVDFDSDGDLDAFIGANNGTTSYYLNIGTPEQAVFVEQTTPINFDVGSDSRPSIVDIDNDGYFEAFVGEKSGNINLYGFDSVPEVYIPEGSTKSSKVTLIAVDDLIDEERETFDIRVTENVDDTLIIEVTSNYESNDDGKIRFGEQPTINYFVGLKINNAEVTDSYFLPAGTVLNFTDSNNTYSVTINDNTVISNTSTEVRIQQNFSLQGLDLVGATTSIINSDYIVNEQSSTGTFEIVDNDIAGLNIVDSDNNPLTSLTTSEDGSTETFYVSLDSKPTDNVAVYLGVENSGEGLLSDNNESDENLVKLVFSPDNWDTLQAVTLTSVNDDVDDNNITYNIISTVISEDIKYNEDNVILKITEDFNYVDGSSNTISLLVDDLSVQETELAAGTQLTFANGMILEVDSDTTLSNSMASSVNVTQVQAANQILKNTTTFIDEDNSNLTEYVQIIVTEEYADGRLELQIDENSSIASIDLSLGQQLTFSNGTVFTVEVAETLSNTEASTIFGTIDSNLLKVANTEVSTNATAEVTTDYTDKDSGRTEIIVDTDYNEATGTVSLSINDSTASTVELIAGTQIDFSNGAAVTLDEDVTLTTTASSVNVSGVGNEITTSFTESISTDISVTNNDNDTAAVVVDRYDISSLEGYGNNFFNVKLATKPLGEVTVTMNPVDVNGDKDYNISLDDEFDGESYSVTFDETNWNLAKAVKVTAVDDYDIEYNHSSYIDFTVSSDEDSTYDGATATGDVVVKIEDNDLPSASIQAVAAASEAGSPGYFIVSLDQAAPDGFDGTGIVVNYSVSGTVDVGSVDTDDLKTLTGSVRIAPGETRSPIIAFPIDDFKVEAIPLEVVKVSGNTVELEINTANLSDSQKQSLIELDGVTLDSGTELTFSNGAIANVISTVGELKINPNGTVTPVNATVEFTSDITTVVADETTSIPEETVVVTLSSGSDYSINEEEPPSAILSIQDNDTPGVRIVEIGDTTVTENGTSEFYVSLLSQPEADVTISLNGVPTERKLIVDQAYSNTASTIQLKVDDSSVSSLLLQAGTYTLGNASVTVSSDTTIFSDKFTEVAVSSISSNIAANDSLTYSYTELGFDNTYTFNSDNWYKLQTITVKGIDDSVVETGDFHTSTVEYTVSSTDSNYDGFEVAPQTINIIDRTFDKENTTESLVEGFFALQDGLDSVTLPIIGNLDGVAPSFIEDFIGDLVEEVKRTEYVTAESLQDAFNNVLSDRFGMVNVEITDLSTDNIEFKINIEDSFNKSIFLNGDLGLPALGIKIESDGSIDANFDYGINLAFGISTDDGFYINTEDTGFEVGASLGLSDEFTATGKLAFLQIEATNGDNIGGTNIDAKFNISLEDADTSDDSNDEDEKKLTLTELNNLRKSDNLFDSIKYGFSGDAALDLDVVTSIKGNTGFPSFGLNISSNLPLFNYSNTDDEDEDENVKLTVVSSSTNSLNIESSDSTNIVRLNKDTELTFGNTSVIVKEDTDIKPGEETTVNVTLADGTIAADTIIETSKIPLLTISSSITSQEGKITTLEVTSNNENIIRLKKDTELNFGGTRVILKKVILSTGDVDINSELIDIQPGDTPTTIEVTVVGDKDNNSGEFLTIDKDTTVDVSAGEILNSDPSLTVSEEVTSKEGASTTLKVTSNNVTDTIQLNKGTQLKFGETGHKVTLEETAYIESGDTPTEIKVTVADDGDDTKEESVTIAKDETAELVSSKFNLSFNDITLDTGGFITDLMSPIINYVNDLIEPFEPIIDVLQTEIKFLDTVNLVDLFDENNDGSATLIEVASYLASTFSGTDLKYQKFFNAVTGIIDLVDTLKDLESDINSGENLSINFGDYTLQNFKGASDDEEDSASNTDTEESGGEALNSDTKDQAKNSGNSSSGSIGTKITNFFSKLDELGISIPLIEDPFMAVNLLLGQDIDLVTYDIPELDINFQISQEFPIFGTISGLLEGAFSLSSDLVVGFDTYGLSRWEDKGFKLKDSYLIFDGFYLSDVDPDTGEDVDELTMDATIAAGVSASAVVAKAELTGGITGKAGLDIIDGGEFTGESDGKLRGSEVLAANSLFDLFSLSGSLEAFIKAVVKVGVDVGLFEVMKTVWKEKYSITLFEFELGGSSGTVSQSYIEGAKVFFDSNLDGIWQEGEPITTSNADGSYNLEIPLLYADTNENGKIDPEEGRIVTEGGTDTSSGVAVETPLIAPYGAKMVTPLTTLKQKLIEDGSTPEEAEQLIKEALEIPEDIKLEEFDALDAMSKGDERGSKVYKAHVQMQSLFAQTSEFMKGFDGEDLEDKKRPIPEQAIDAIAKGFKKRKGKGKGKSPIDFNDSAELEELIKEPLEGKIKPKSADKREKLPKSFSVLSQTMASGNKEIDEVFKGVPAKDILGKVAPVKKRTQEKLPKELRKLIGGAKREDIAGLLERVPDAEQFLTLSGEKPPMKDESGNKPPMKDESGNKPAMKDEQSGQPPKENQNPQTVLDSLENTIRKKAKKLAKGKGRRNLLELDGDDLTDTKIKFSLSSKNLPAGRIHEIAIFTTEDQEGTINGLSPEDTAYKQAALTKARSIFSILPDDFITNPERIMKGFANQNIGFLLVKNGTLDSVRRGRTSLDSVLLGTETQGDGFRGIQMSETGESSFQLSFEDELGAADFTDIVINAELTDETPEIGTDTQGGSEGETLDLRGYAGKRIKIEAPIVREESVYENVVGFYVVEDETGAVIDPLTGNLLNPGDQGYTQAALRNSQNNAFQMGETGLSGSFEMGGGQMFAPFAIANGTLEQVLDDNPNNDPQVYFAYMGANSDGFDHIRNLGGNTWGVEDLPDGGDMDYNDIVFKLNVTVM